MRPLLFMAVVTLVALTGWRLWTTERELTQERRIIGTLSAGIESRDSAIDRLTVEAHAAAKREAALRLLQGRASHAAFNRERQIERETDANPTLQRWSAAALPADVIRLHSRPAFGNARDYLAWLSARDQLPAAGQQPANAGRSGR